MDTKRIITNEDSKRYFESSLNTIDHAMGIAKYHTITKTISFDFNAVLLLDFDNIYAEENYPVNDKHIDQHFIQLIDNEIPKLNIKSTFKYNKEILGTEHNFEVKLEKTGDVITIYILCFQKLISDEKTIKMVSKLLGTGENSFVGNTWWIDYDYHANHFYQSDYGPSILGIPIEESKLYSTRKFQTVREKARKHSPFFDECVSMEKANYDQVRYNKTDYFGGRTPAYTKDNKIVWVEAYGKCLIRYPDGSPRFFIAIDIYLSDLVEERHQLTILNSLINKGLTNSNVGVWYYQKHFKQGRYYFTKSHIELMKLPGVSPEHFTVDHLPEHFKHILKDQPQFKPYLDNFTKTHRKIFTGELDKYSVIFPNYTYGNKPKWIEARGTVIERDPNGDIVLFVGINVDITDSFLREQELVKLRTQNERLRLTEKLAIKAGNVMVWSQDKSLIKEKLYLFGNESFVKKLGLSRTNDGMVPVSDLLKSFIEGTKNRKDLRRDMLVALRKLYSSTKDSTNNIYNIISRHKNLKTGEIFYFSNSIEVEHINEVGEITLVGGIMVDVTENIIREEKINYLANHDTLSGLYNRNYFESYINNKLPKNYSLGIFDLDGLKLINDAFGHLEGDRVIKVIAQALKEVFSDNLFIARIGGDEFVVLMSTINEKYINDLFKEFDLKISEYNQKSSIEINVSRAGILVVDSSSSFERVFTQAENRMYKRKLNNRSSRKSKVLESIIETLNQKTEETKEHSFRLGKLAIKTMKVLNMTRESEKEDILLLARVHDIGKITIPDNILNKPSKLTDEEYEIIKKHSEAGYKIIKNITDSDQVSQGVLSHHERWDGNGYPQGLKGDSIPIYARIISVVDAYDAMTSARIYQPAKTHEEAIEELIKCKGTQFDPRIVDAFIKGYTTSK